MNTRFVLMCLMFGTFILNSNYAMSKDKIDCTVGHKPIVIRYKSVNKEEYQQLIDSKFTVTYNVTEKGEPRNIKAKESNNSKDVVKRMLKALKKWRFRPAIINEKAYYQKSCELTFLSKY